MKKSTFRMLISCCVTVAYLFLKSCCHFKIVKSFCSGTGQVGMTGRL